MPKYTNKHRIPEMAFRALTEETYAGKAGRWSVTQIIDPPQKRVIQEANWDDVEIDVLELQWAAFGTALHALMEKGARPEEGDICEKEFGIKVLGVPISCHPDCYNSRTHELWDWKSTTVWGIKGPMRPRPKEDWIAQINCYAEILRANGHSPTKAKVLAFVKDWSLAEKMQYGRGYPDLSMAVIDVPLWTSARCWNYLEDRVRIHLEAEEGRWEPCTAEERWERDSAFAVMFKGAKRAMPNGVFKITQDCPRQYAMNDALKKAKQVEAKEAKKKKGRRKVEIEERIGASRRCQEYCYAAPWCPQWAKIKEETGQTEAKHGVKEPEPPVPTPPPPGGKK